MIVRYVGHSCFYLRSSEGLAILTDPYQPGAYGGAVGLAPVQEKADVVLVSHDHEDHSHVSDLSGSPLMLKDSGSARGVEFTTVDTFHDKSQGRERGANKIFCFTLDGIRVCHLGDLGHLLSPAQATQVGPIDLLLIPVGGFFTLEPEEAAEVVGLLKPKLVIPMHFKVPKIGLPIKPVDDFLKTQNNARRLPKSEVDLTTESLPAQPEVYVLDPANG